MVITDAKNLRTTALAPNYFEPRRPCLRRVPDCLTFCPQFTIPLCLDRYTMQLSIRVMLYMMFECADEI
ncbi:hypothetical protein Hanom_Chr03g00255421 [Helianthus anomalus]